VGACHSQKSACQKINPGIVNCDTHTKTHYIYTLNIRYIMMFICIVKLGHNWLYLFSEMGEIL